MNIIFMFIFAIFAILLLNLSAFEMVLVALIYGIYLEIRDIRKGLYK